MDEVARTKMVSRHVRRLAIGAPIVMGILMMFHCALLLMGHDFFVIHILCMVGGGGFWIMMYLNWLYKLCWVHRLYVIYTFLMTCCIEAQEWCLFDKIGIDVFHARHTMLIAGIMIQIAMIWTMNKRNCFTN